MKVKIIVTKDGFSIIIKKKDGSIVKQKHSRIGHSYKLVEGVKDFENEGFLEETLDALDCHFSLMDISNALETEDAEYDYAIEGDIMTKDGVKLQKGDLFYQVACTVQNHKPINVPLRSKFPQDWHMAGTEIYSTLVKCREECDRLNNEGIN